MSGEQDRGSHPTDEPDFNKDIVEMLHDELFPAPLDAEPALWMGQQLP